ncbi:MAG TPA: LLM class flavin-dependent oxidoreductase [Steroidobacteraceae bacterium]|jgi:alkanesulfonate monooxygenase SsuD/methylene tetrahydromethanopterin reductase-like flavin-dependent oxidoreductase (luciferase family)|nr:LLM class flavin-dependent oxidoreductase [Steroidobacteraceae bacterium]
MKFGVMDHVDDSGRPPHEHFETRLRFTETLDQLGFYSYHVAEHHGTPLGFAPSPNVYLAAVAQRTRQLRFGPMVYVAALYHPMRLAEEICMLDQLSGGRLQIGMGRGAVALEQELYDVDPATTQQRYEEARDIVLAALSSPQVDFSGEYFQVRDFPMILQCLQQPRPPLWYGLGNPDAAVWAAKVCAHVISLRPAAAARVAFERYRQEWQALGRAPQDLPFMGVCRHVVVAETEAEAQAAARAAFPRWRASLAALWERRGVPLPVAMPLQWDELQAHGMAIAGTAQSVAEYVRAQNQAAGANFFLSQLLFGDMPLEIAQHSARLFAFEVAPRLAA